MNTTVLSVFLFMAIFMIICMMSSYLVLLIFLELIMFISFLFYMTLGGVLFSGYHFVYNLIFMVMMIFEGVYGLSLMISVSRGEGGDFFMKW